MKYWKYSLISATILIVGGLGVIMYTRDKQTTVVTPAPTTAQIATAKASAVQPSTPAVISGEPVGLTIPSLGINLAVTPGVYNTTTQQWTLTNDKVQYAVVTPEPNTQSGNTFFYGHYRKGVFSTLHTIQAGSEAQVTTSNGRVFTYKLADIKVVSPEDSASVFNYEGAPILTIQTCTGLLFQNRQLFIFDLEGVS